jgi:hypothetical protein
MGQTVPRWAEALLAGIQPLAQQFAGFEKWYGLFRNVDGLAGSGIASLPSISPFDRKGPETAQFNPITSRQGGGDLIKNSGHDTLNVALVEMGIQLCQAGN